MNHNLKNGSSGLLGRMSQGDMKTDSSQVNQCYGLIVEGSWHPLPHEALSINLGTGVGDFCFGRAVLVIAWQS